jgi:hypothetical protein
LPGTRYEVADWKQARVNIDYHVEFDGHYYSVPFRHAREKVDIRFTNATLEVFLKGVRVAVHKRSFARGRHTAMCLGRGRVVELPESEPCAGRGVFETDLSPLISGL